MKMTVVSPFLSSGPTSREGQLVSLHLRRDLSLPVILSTSPLTTESQGYAEGVVTNTRFGSFPHSTIIGEEWGSQIRASKVDTGSRGRKDYAKNRKRKADESIDIDESMEQPDMSLNKEAVTASSGFIHMLRPTPENWTTSLPHRTQVVYTPDYSYILHRIRARPGSRLIEAGSGSGSFTHAAARAVFNGYFDDCETKDIVSSSNDRSRPGKVFTYEFHADRHQKIKEEMVEHGLDSIVQAIHRDVYNDGFVLSNESFETKTFPAANSVFLDLPAPWEALRHLTRDTSSGQLSALDPLSSVRICTFSPCIEQAQKTVSSLRQYGWLDIEMAEVQHKRIEVRRDYTGLEYEGMRGVNPVAADVNEAVHKLREVEKRAKDFHAGQTGLQNGDKRVNGQDGQLDAPRTLFKGGKLIHRSEPEIKTHTSYLVFAVLPRDWTEEDETNAHQQYSMKGTVGVEVTRSKGELRKDAKKKPRDNSSK